MTSPTTVRREPLGRQRSAAVALPAPLPWRWSAIWLGMALLICWFVGLTPLYAQPGGNTQQQTVPDLSEEEVPIIDREPFDRLHFDRFNNNRTLDVNPIELDGFDVNQSIDPNKMQGRLVFSMPDYPGRVFAVQWEHLIKIERYVELVLQESEKAMQANDYATAFKTLMFLEENSEESGSIRLRQLMNDCLYGDAQNNFQQSNFSEALTAYEELYRRNPRYQGDGSGTVLEKIIQCIDQFVSQQIEQSEFERARELLRYVETEYGSSVNDVVDKWEQEMVDRALQELKNVQQQLEAGDGMAAHRSVRRLMYVNPDLPESTQTFNEVVTKYPYVFVGVAQPAAQADIRHVEDWAARRAGRLTRRWLMEFLGPGDEGGKYQFPGGRIQRIDDLGLKYRILLDPSSRFGVPKLSAYDLSNRLLDLADPDSPDYYIPWARIVKTIEIEDENAVAFTLRYPHVRPEALLTAPFYPPVDARAQQDNGVYSKVAENETEAVYELNPDFTPPAGAQFPRVVERLYNNTSEATEALLRGELDIVDRVFPADIPRLKRHPMIDVRAYIVPTVHVLIPNPRQEFMESDHFRRALHFGINRELILDQLIAGGQEMDGFEVVSGPFPPGSDTADQLAYAYNNRVQSRRYSGQLCLVLSQQYKMEARILRERDGEVNPEIPDPTIVLAHPDTDLINSICDAMAQQWRALGITTELRRLPVGVTVPEDDDDDLLFCELQIQEPLVDAHRLFGRGGLVKMVDPTIEQALRQLDSAYSWAEVSIALRRVHEQSSNNLTILPLWQIVEHFAYRKNVFNMGDQLVFLYQNIDRWRIAGIQERQASTQ